MTKRILACFLLCWLLVQTGTAVSAERSASMVLSEMTNEVSAAPYLLILPSSDHKLSLSDVLKPEQQASFQPSGPLIPNYGYDAGIRWFKLLINNQSEQREWLLDYAYPPIDRVDLFVVKADGTVITKEGGDLLPFLTREIKTRTIAYRLPLERGQTTELYIRVETQGAMTVPLELYKPDAYAVKEQSSYLALGMYYGMLVVLTLYNTVLAFSLRSRVYFYYVAINTSVLLLYVSFNGIGYQYIWPNAVWWNNRSIVFFICLSLLAMVIFTISFLEGRRLFPRLRRLFLLAAAWEAFNMLVVLVHYPLGLHMAMYSTLFVEAAIVAAGVFSWKRGFGPARVFLLGWGAFMLGAIVSSLADAGYLPYTTWTENASQVGSALEAMILSWALAARIRQIRKERESALAEIRETRHLADHDDLTGLYNRRYLTAAYEGMAAQRRQMSLLLIDIDYFKRINDTYGHDAGDIVLRRIARLLQDCFRPSDVVGRFGGEEFMAVLPDTGLESARRAGEYVLQTIREAALSFGGAALHCTVSIGVAEWTGDSDDSLAHVLRRADEALYVAKEGGRDQVVATA